MTRPDTDVTVSSLHDEGALVSLSEIVSALSFALDLVEDARPGHAIRCCLLGLRIARRLGVSEAQQADLYYASLLKDIGCSNNARLVTDWVGGDDRAIKREAKLQDWTRKSFASILLMWKNGPAGATLLERIRRLYRMATHPEGISVVLIRARCERGAAIAYKMGLSIASAEAIRALDEHWDGGGQPDNARGEEIPILARIMAITQHLDLFGSEFGPTRAMAMLRERSGHWFDPAIVDMVSVMDRDYSLWLDLWSDDARHLVLENEPGILHFADDAQIDRIVEAFADVIDAKSSFTYRHSMRVTNLAIGIASQLQLEPARIRTLYRAALLHDIGKLRVPNTILDKETTLTAREWHIIRQHPGLTREVLARVEVFSDVASIAGGHHEKLDGSGYPEGIEGEQIPLETRILTMADIYSAMTEERPYRKQRTATEALSLIRLMVPLQLDPNCFNALTQHLSGAAA